MDENQTNIGTLCVGLEAKVGSFADLSGIESAISATTIAAGSAEGITLTILQEHLKKLCKLQRAVLSTVGEPDAS